MSGSGPAWAASPAAGGGIGTVFPAAPELDARRFRSVLGLFATGVVAVTAMDPATGQPVGVTANSFTSVSLSPPLVCFCMAHTSTTWPRIRAARGHCINILAQHQRGTSAQLAASGRDRLGSAAWRASPAGHPILDGALGWLECAAEAEHLAGDHVIVVCRVLHLGMRPEGRPLIFYRGSYGRLETMAARTG